MTSTEELAARLGHPDPGIRRIAIRDLMARGPSEAAALDALTLHLAREPDERAALLIIRHLAARGYAPARPILMDLYRDRSTAVRIAHAAINAHDAIPAALE